MASKLIFIICILSLVLAQPSQNDTSTSQNTTIPSQNVTNSSSSSNQINSSGESNISSSNQSNISQSNSTYFYQGGIAETLLEMANGFFVGLKRNQSQSSSCYNDSGVLTELSQVVYMDIMDYARGNSSAKNQIYINYDNLENYFNDRAENDCDWDWFFKLYVEISVEGLRKIIDRIVGNINSVASEWMSLDNCTSNYTACGENWGSLTRQLVLWEI
ncbi:unnamed protein product [Blepharisma stoltei]|uniref:Uncharacterized protein n=1 Tax=Blepharisma stoltei TaxID=1481888 RepID=A0AAU9KKQ8_9CILI|nr:unnamed protein product [Blepharisma stoltei]